MKSPLARLPLLGPAALAALAVLPLHADGGQAECSNATTSLASLRNDPTAGDEAFFKLPSGPANVMLLLDVSGSMMDVPQCPNMGWGSGSSCRSPALANPTGFSAVTGTPVVRGTCLPATDPLLAAAERVPDSPANCSTTGVTPCTPGLNWMEAVTPQTAYADPGGTNALLTDRPPWGNGCVGDACMFDPAAYYFYYDWWSGATPSWNFATRRASDSDPTLPGACLLLNSSGTPVKDVTGNVVSLGAGCSSCMTTHGFYFFKVTYAYSGSAGSYSSRTQSGFYMKGTFLNANPPKFVSSRKAVKTLAWMDPSAPRSLDQIRLGLTILDSGASGNQRAQLIVPLGPDRNSSFPPTQNSFQQARQTLISVVNLDSSNYTDAGGNVIVDGTAISGGFFDPANGSTPLASALFNIGQYFSTPGTTLGTGFYGTTFGAASEIASFQQTSAGLVNAPWVTKDPADACSTCWACQNNSVVILTDGMPNSEINFSQFKVNLGTYDTSVYTQTANCGSSGTLCGGSPLPRVADWLHNHSLRTDLVLNSRQFLSVYTVGFYLLNAQAKQVLQATANMGDAGLFQNALNDTDLSNKLFNAVMQVVTKENSFSAASANSLQTVQTSSAEAFLTRFMPNQTHAWEGHLFRAGLFDEFLNGCDPTKPPSAQPTVSCGAKTVSASFNGDFDPVTGNATCKGVFLIDQDCDEIAEDPTTGTFVKKGVGTPANFPWDAGQVLSDAGKPGYRSADGSQPLATSPSQVGGRRNIFTYVNGAKVEVIASNAATLKPLMNINASWCTTLLTRLGITSADPTTECARQVIHYVRGWDVLDEDGDKCAGPGNPKNTTACPSGLAGEERNRANDGRSTPLFYKLGDVFHSSPAVVNVPVDEFRCDTGFEKQCVPTLHSPSGFPSQTAIDSSYPGLAGGTTDAYDRYRLDNRTRARVVLAGANDGMLHAFHAGDADTSQPTDPVGGYTFTAGTGAELWAFVPPDLLPRLAGLLDRHQYMVDGSVMVRDVWVDGNGDFKKQKGEYHTVAIFGERTGGTQYHALDVTDPSNPVALWLFTNADGTVNEGFPRPASDDATSMGQSWSDFAPRPPPIGPVRLANAGDPRGFEERWVVMINGGFDPAMDRGRAVYMVDAWTGKTLWRFTDDDFKAQQGYGSGTSMFPVPAGVSMVDIGDPTQASSDADGFFDTATWGDLGGNLWVARFWDPGTVDAGTGRVTNWYAARTFEQQRRTDDLQGVANRSEFFYMTANTFEPTSRTLRTFLGSGNRERMMDQTGSCTNDNLVGCCQGGCAISTSTTDDFGSCNATGSFSCTGSTGTYARPATTSTSACPASPAVAACGAAPTNQYTSTTTTQRTCPGSATPITSTSTVTCTAAGACTTAAAGEWASSGSFAAPPRNRFYGVWAYGGVPQKMFRTAADARTFDRNRFTDASFSGTCTGPAGSTCTLRDTTRAQVTYALSSPQLVSTTCLAGAPVINGVATCTATSADAGWFYEYGNVCPLASCSPAPPWNDEKTGSGATVVLGCTAWGGFRPYGASTSTDPCSGSLGTPVTYGYVADFVTGVPGATCGYASGGNVYRATPRSTTAPPTGATVRITFSPSGSISYSTLQVDAGSPPTSMTLGTRSEIAEPVYWLEVPRTLHSCRHVANSGLCE